MPDAMKQITDKFFLEEIKRHVHEIDPKADVWLFGSRARGDFREDSDWDILVLTSQPVNQTLKYEILDHLCELELEAEQVLGVLVHQKDEWEDLELTDLYQNIKDEGRPL
jgi:predicted nucleotidyltransferase